MDKIFLLSFCYIFLTLSFSVYAQKNTLYYIKNNNDEFIKEYNINFTFYQEGDSLTYTSNEKAEIMLPSQLYKQSDSIKAKYSFYSINLYKNNFVKDTIYLNQDLTIDEVVLKAGKKKEYYLGPNKTYFINFNNKNGFKCDCVRLISFKNDSIKNLQNIKDIRFAFKNDILSSVFGSANKRIEIILVGFNNYSHIPKKNTILKEPIIYKIPKKIGKWSTVSLSGKIKSELPEYKYIAFGFKIIDWGTVILTDKRKDYPTYYLLKRNLRNKDTYDLDQDDSGLPIMQLIYEQ